MKIAYLDCFSGVSGNMLLGALLDAGLPRTQLAAELAKLSLPGYELKVERVSRGFMTGTHVEVVTTDSPPHRHLTHILGLIEASKLEAKVKEQAARVFRRLAEAVSLFTFGKKDKISFDEDKGEVTAEDIIILLERQAVRFKVSNGDEREIIPTIRIQPLPGKDDLNSGFGISMNEAQASELVERLGMFLEAALLRRTASKTKTIAAPARTKRTTAPASA